MTRFPIETACPEKRLLVACARTTVPPAVAEEIRTLASGPLDWEFLLAAAAENSVTPLLARHLAAWAKGALSADQLAQLNDAARANAVRSLILVAELIRITDAFAAAGVQAIPYKGPVIAVQAYGDVTLREFEDLDIVLRQRDMPAANEVMTRLGFRPKYPWILSASATSALIPGEYDYFDDNQRVVIELHTELTLRHFPVPPDLDDFARRLVPVVISGHEVQTFAPEDALLALCIHGSKDFWERISWIADVAELVRAHTQLDWDAVWQRAGSLHAQRMLHLGLALAHELLDATLPEPVLTRVRRDPTALSLASEIETRLLGRATPRWSLTSRLRFRRRMLTGTVAGWRYAARLAVVPAEEDWMMLRLPGPLAPLYLALRPLRLLLKYGRRD
jgi:putative nucleotidyltransferase-like protein